MQRFALISLLFLTACATSSQNPRTPANVTANPTVDDPMKHMFSNFAVAQAFVLGEPDAQGHRKPLCRYPVAGHPELVPAFMKVDSRETKVTFGLKTCAVPELNRMAEVAAIGSRPVVAGLPIILAVCAVDAALGFTLQATLNKGVNESDASPAERAQTAKANSAVHFVPGAVEYMTAAAVKVGAKATTAVGLFGAPAVFTAACTGAGVGIGYWLVPVRFAAKP